MIEWEIIDYPITWKIRSSIVMEKQLMMLNVRPHFEKIIHKNKNKYKQDILQVIRNEYVNMRLKQLNELCVVRAARKIWYDAWIPYWYCPGNSGFIKDMQYIDFLKTTTCGEK